MGIDNHAVAGAAAGPVFAASAVAQLFTRWVTPARAVGVGCAMLVVGTLVVGLRQNSDRDARQAASQLHLYQNTRNVARMIREKIMSFAKR